MPILSLIRHRYAPIYVNSRILAVITLVSTMAGPARADKPAPSPVVLITGSFRGLGMKIAEDMLAKGYRVVLTGRSLSAAPAFAFDNPQALALEVDVQNPESITEALKQIDARWHRLDAVVHNANVTPMAAGDQLTPETLDQAMHTNFQGPVRLTQMVMPIFQRQKFGRVVYLSSAASLLHEADMAAYNSSKAAAEAYFLTMAGEMKKDSRFAGQDVDVSVLRLSFVRSDYEPKVQVAETVGADRRAFVRMMAWLRNHSPTTDRTVSRAVMASIQAGEGPRMVNLGIDGKMVLGASFVPPGVRDFCQTALAGALSTLGKGG